MLPTLTWASGWIGSIPTENRRAAGLTAEGTILLDQESLSAPVATQRDGETNLIRNAAGPPGSAAVVPKLKVLTDRGGFAKPAALTVSLCGRY